MELLEIVLILITLLTTIAGSIYILFKRGVRNANVYLGTLLILFAYFLFYCVLFWSRMDTDLLTQLTFTYQLCFALYGPLFYLYVRQLALEKKFSPIDLLHLLPLAISIINYWPFYVLPFPRKVEAIVNGHPSKYFNIPLDFDLTLTALTLAYGVFTWYTFRRKFTIEKTLYWFNFICLTFVLVAVLQLLYIILNRANLITGRLDYLLTFLIIIFIYATYYLSWIYEKVVVGQLDILKYVPKFVKYQRTGLSANFSTELKTKLVKLMEEEKPYLESDLNLEELANMLDISRHHTSQVINEHFNQSFNDYINKYRIDEAKSLLSSDEYTSLTIIEVSYRVGFNNRITFYNAFKKSEGISPSDFRKRKKS